MGILEGTIKWKSSLNAEKDGKDICSTISNALKTPSEDLTVFFLAETHRNLFDTLRSKMIYEEFSKLVYQANVILVVERGLFPGCQSLENVVYEGDTDLISSDPQRNARTVNLLKDKLSDKIKIIIFFFGEEHLEPLKKELIQETESSTKIRWVEFLSFTTIFASLPFNDVARFDVAGKIPAGYIALQANDIRSEYVDLLTKGIISPSLKVEIYREDRLKIFLLVRVWKIYFKDDEKHKEISDWVNEDGAIDYTFDSTSTALAVFN